MSDKHAAELTRWTIHGERVVDDSRRARLSVADVELPDGVGFEQYVIRAPKSAMVAVVDEQARLLMMWRHRFVIDRWVWELPGGYVDDAEDVALAAARQRGGSGAAVWRLHACRPDRGAGWYGQDSVLAGLPTLRELQCDPSSRVRWTSRSKPPSVNAVASRTHDRSTAPSHRE